MMIGAGVSAIVCHHGLGLNNRLLRASSLIFITKFLLDMSSLAEAELLHFFSLPFLTVFSFAFLERISGTSVAEKNVNGRRALREVI
jgi:hypothetical protein